MFSLLPLECLEIILENMSSYWSDENLETKLSKDLFKVNQICKYTFIDLIRVSMISKDLYTILSQDDMWYPLLIRDYKKGKYYKNKPNQIKRYYLEKYMLPKIDKRYTENTYKYYKYCYERLCNYENRLSIENSILNGIHHKNYIVKFKYSIQEINNTFLIKSKQLDTRISEQSVLDYINRYNKLLKYTKENVKKMKDIWNYTYNMLYCLQSYLNIETNTIKIDYNKINYLLSIKYVNDIQKTDNYELKNGYISLK